MSTLLILCIHITAEVQNQKYALAYRYLVFFKDIIKISNCCYDFIIIPAMIQTSGWYLIAIVDMYHKVFISAEFYNFRQIISFTLTVWRLKSIFHYSLQSFDSFEMYKLNLHIYSFITLKIPCSDVMKSYKMQISLDNFCKCEKASDKIIILWQIEITCCRKD